MKSRQLPPNPAAISQESHSEAGLPAEARQETGLPAEARQETGLSAESRQEAGAPKPEDAPASVASRQILGLRVDATRYDETAEAVIALARAGRGGSVCCANVHVVMEAFGDPALRRALNAADRVTPDGVPLVWALRWLGVRDAGRVYGPSLMAVVCRRAEEEGIPVGLYGGRAEVLDTLRASLTQKFPRLDIAFAWSPPFREPSPEEERRAIQAVEDAGVRILFVGLGCPKQERWMTKHRDALSGVALGVGAAFDFLSGAKPQAPGWMQRAGLEWLFRLVSEPRRLWRRYLVQNPRFAFHLARQVLAARSSASGRGCR
jgi:N-acetylglucosaminyldiphosphoundecaprenol N-acetyl-beta-D-mannosaminyltransferase